MKKLVVTPTSGCDTRVYLMSSVGMGLEFYTYLMNEIRIFRNSHTRTTMERYDNVLFKYAVT